MAKRVVRYFAEARLVKVIWAGEGTRPAFIDEARTTFGTEALPKALRRYNTMVREGAFATHTTPAEMGRRGGLARAKKLSRVERSAIARMGGQARWKS